ncbi:hypothetical protein [Hirschia maritima]|uniref:hypothetical protein n=1 Tax=Hirschia maritima TaxID=1121961 RepID=UPI0003A7F863|nr:hypothetical protein [Hirschia maritima]
MRQHIKTIGCALMLLGLAVSAGCATPTQAQIEQRAYNKLLRHTSVQDVGKGQFIVESWGGVHTDADSLELRLLARAADATLRAGKENFAVVQLFDRNKADGGVMISDEVWIGSYSDIVASRFDRNLEGSLKDMVKPGLKAIIQIVDPSHPEATNTFKAQDTYDTLNREKML